MNNYERFFGTSSLVAESLDRISDMCSSKFGGRDCGGCILLPCCDTKDTIEEWLMSDDMPKVSTKVAALICTPVIEYHDDGNPFGIAVCSNCRHPLNYVGSDDDLDYAPYCSGCGLKVIDKESK